MNQKILETNPTEFKIITFLGKRIDITCGNRIRRELEISLTTIYKSIKSLEKKEIIVSYSKSKKLRTTNSKYWKLTDKGREIYNLIMALGELLK